MLVLAIRFALAYKAIKMALKIKKLSNNAVYSF